MAIILYELAGADPAVRFSPYCWRTRMALAHKGLEVESVPWRFSDKATIAFTDQGRVPVIRDGDRIVFDSWAIAEYLEAAYPGAPSLLGGAGGHGMARFVNSWADHVLVAGIARLVLADIHSVLAPQDKDYFRTSREARFGQSLEAVQADRDSAVAGFRQSLAPIRVTLGAQPFLGGAAPNYADYIVLGTFQWPRIVSAFQLLAADDPIYAWRERMLDLFGGLARNAPARG